MSLGSYLKAARGGPRKIRLFERYEEFRRRVEREGTPVKSDFRHWLRFRVWERYWRTL